jgi:hypothetical protein
MNIGLLIKQSGFSKSCDGTDSHVGDYEDFERLTKAILEAALEEAAKVCDEIDQRDDIHPDHVAIECAAAIRGLK